MSRQDYINKLYADSETNGYIVNKNGPHHPIHIKNNLELGEFVNYLIGQHQEVKITSTEKYKYYFEVE